MTALTVGTPSSSAAVHIVNLYKSFRFAPVLVGLNLLVDRGECVFLVGPSGSGKTTLLSIIGCMLSPDRGLVHVLGNDVNSLSRTRRGALRLESIGFVFQRFHLIRGLTVFENVCLPLTLQGASSRTARVRAFALLEAVGLVDKAQSHPSKLSAGQCQRVAIARALAGDPDLILADEPTASLDAHNGAEIMQLLRQLTTEQGKTTIVVTHDPRIFQYADRVCSLENGCIAPSQDSDAIQIINSQPAGCVAGSENGGAFGEVVQFGIESRN